MTAREARRLAKKERREAREETRILIRLLILLFVVALVHVAQAIHVKGLIVGVSTFIALRLLPRVEQAVRRLLLSVRSRRK